MPERVLCAMSGGVDSSVTALLLQRAGYEVVGMTALLFGDASASGPCCGKAGISSAGRVCEQLGIEHHWVDMSELFEKQVIGRFLDNYEQGRTPNPCSDCNRFIKFEAFFDFADKHGCELLATGHYARIVGTGFTLSAVGTPLVTSGIISDIEQAESARAVPTADAINGVPTLRTALDANKDQSYFLACIPPERLARILFPLGGLTKPQVRAIAEEAGLVTAQRKESQDVCFMANGMGIAELLSWHRGREPQPGRILDNSGRELGQHRGYENYTIGQRRGLSLGGGTEGLAVQQIDAATNTVLVADPREFTVKALILSDYVDMAPGLWQPGLDLVQARARYRQALWPARVCYCSGGVMVVPEEPLCNIARGQWCVGYDGETVLFGGIVKEIEYRSL